MVCVYVCVGARECVCVIVCVWLCVPVARSKIIAGITGVESSTARPYSSKGGSSRFIEGLLSFEQAA